MSTAMQEPSKSSSQAGDVEVEEVNPKLLKVLKKLLQPKLKLHNDDYLNLLLNHITKSEDSPDGLTPRDLKTIKQLLPVWLKGAVIQFEKINEPPNPHILTFVLNITTYLCKEELMFVTLNSDDIFERLLTIVKRVSKPNVTVALIKMICTFIDHKSGLQWIISTNHWKLLIDIILNNETVYVSKEGNLLITKLLVKSIAVNTTFCKNVIETILTPLEDTTENMPESAPDQCDTRCLSTTVQILNEVLTILLKDCKNPNENAVILLFIEKYNLEKRIRKLISLFQNVELKTELMKLIILLSLYVLRSKFSGLQIVHVEKTEIYWNVILNIFYQAATEVSILCMMKLLYMSHTVWFDIKATMPTCFNTDQKVVSFEDQILALQVLPALTIFVKHFGIKVYIDDDKDDDIRFRFFNKYVEKINPKIMRLKYKWMEHLLDNFSFNDGILALKYLVHSKQFYNKDNAVVAFQLLIYLIRDLTIHLKLNSHVQLPFLQEPEYLALHLKVMEILIEEFDVKWKDSLEAFCVLNLMYSLLNGFVWPTKIVVNALKLAGKGISKYFTFQMALLVDIDVSVMNDFPPVLNVKLHDGAWEVRDSTVELIHEFAIAANNTKFSSYNRLILENNFPLSMVRMATSDGNSYVRASALKCLQEMIKDATFWDSIISNCNIYVIILKILQMETEGIVRSEAATLVGSIYEHQSIPHDLLIKFYDVMSHAVVADLHWEVRVNALKYWRRVIDDHLTQQGMIDGSFPNVTFSKQLKKIVTLSPFEVRKRLVIVLQELSEIGCLSVFYEAIQDECDLEVSKLATQTISDFVGLLKQHELSKESFQNLAPTCPIIELGQKDIPVLDEMDLGFDSPSQEVPFSEDIMDQILDTRDLNLLESVFNKQDTPVMENIELKKHSILCPIKFLDLVYTDLERRLSEKTKIVQGVDNFQSLLDDILKEYEPTDVNTMDCY